jgi:ATP-binding cassette subfamily A (ABC1) protein 3
MQTICTTAVADPANFCTSPCYTLSLGPWLDICGDQADVVLTSLGYGLGILVGPLLRLGEQCEAQQGGGPEALQSCWGGEFSEARCCDTSRSELGDPTCWSGDFSFDTCCSSRPASGSDANNIAYTILYNGTSKHATIAFSNVMSNSIKGPGSTISTYNHPLPQTFAGQALIDNLSALQAVLFIMIAFSFVPGGIVVFVVREKEAHHNSKHQQMVSGVRIPSYWLSNWVWDLGLYTIPLVLSMLCIRLVGLKTFNDNGAFHACFVLLAGFGWAAGPFTYLASFAYQSHTKAQIFTVLFNVFLGMGLMIAHYVMSLIESTQEMNAMLLPWYRISPGFCLGHGLWQLSVQNLVKAYTGADIVIDPLSPGVAGNDALALLWAGPAFMLAAIAVDFLQSYPAAAARITAVTQRSLRAVEDPPLSDEDEDVVAERHRIGTEPAEPEELIRLQELRKVYGNKKKHKVAVRGASFSVRSGEVLGYLGINGAGKTSTMKMLTGDILPTSGQAHLGGMDILTQQRQVRRLIGYCPQFDALLDRLTVREHLELFARIRGVEKEALNATVVTVMRRMDLTRFENKLAGTLSGGNKRKLSVGIALIGGPPIVFLDEPTTGVDPVARRFLWNVISELCTQRQDCAVVLTTHVMEEVEALCTRVGIMVGGRLRCLGSIQHLKGRFGRGYKLEVKLQQPSALECEALAQSKLGLDAGLQKVLSETLVDVCEKFGDRSRADACRGTDANPDDPDAPPTGCEDESGWVVWDALERLGYVPIDLFCEWWLLEARIVTLNDFVADQFPGSQVVERHGSRIDYALSAVGSTPRSAAAQGQLQIAVSTPPVHSTSHSVVCAACDGSKCLFLLLREIACVHQDVFRKVEESKLELSVEEYSVTQSSLETIFNEFAGQQVR